MPTRPSAARRSFHTDRVIAKRMAQARDFRWTRDREFVRGRLDDEQWYLGCHRASCGLCHWTKNQDPAGRQREDREWRRYESLAAGA